MDEPRPNHPLTPAVSQPSALPATVSLDVPPALVQVADRFMELQEKEYKLRSEEGARQAEENKMEIKLDYNLRNKQLDYDREERREARQERAQIRRWILWPAGFVTVVMVAAILKGKEATAIEFVKLLAMILGLAASAYLYGERRAQKQQANLQAALAEKDDTDDKEDN